MKRWIYSADAFANKLHAALEQIVSGQPKSAGERRAMWEKYHKLRSIDLPVIWKALILSRYGNGM